jgi:hypothetical protein
LDRPCFSPFFPLFFFLLGRHKLGLSRTGNPLVTSGALNIALALEVGSPAAKLLVMAAQAQEAEVLYLASFSFFTLVVCSIKQK